MKIKEQMEEIEFPDVLIHLRRFLRTSELAVRPEPETDEVLVSEGLLSRPVWWKSAGVEPLTSVAAHFKGRSLMDIIAQKPELGAGKRS